MFSLDFSDSLAKLNFIGVVSLFGGEIALSALRYSVLIQNTYLSLYVTMILSPGLQAVSLKMFRRMEDKISRAIGGGSDDRKDIIGLSASNKYRYIGLHSGTKMAVASVLGEALIGSSEPHEKINVACSRKGGSPKRGLRLKVIRLGEPRNAACDEEYGPCLFAKGKLSLRLFIIPLITIVGMVIVLLADYQVFALILLNIICNMLVTFTIRSNGIKYPTGTAAQGSPKGDVLVESVDGTELCLIIGGENIIQYVLQKPLVMPPNPDIKLWRYLHILAAYSSYFMVILNIIWLPFTTAGGQIIFGVLVFFGVIQNILMSTFDGGELLLKITEDFLTIISVKEYTFQPRSAAIAFCVLQSGSSNPKPFRYLLPDTDTFDTWFDNVAKVINGDSYEDSEDGLLNALNTDLKDALIEHNKKKCM